MILSGESANRFLSLAAVILLGCFCGDSIADVFNMQPGQTSMSLVPVGNLGNAPDTTGYGAVEYQFSMGKFEITAGQYVEFLNAVAGADPYKLTVEGMFIPFINTSPHLERHGTSPNFSYSVALEWANRPMSFLRWGSAARFANWLTNGQPTGPQSLSTTEDGSYFLNGAITGADLSLVTRKPDARFVIPTENEWYKSAYHKNDGPSSNYWLLATASDVLPSNDLSNPLPDPGNNANFLQGSDFTLGYPYFRTEVGDFENSESPYGTFDQSGNVFEWTETLFSTNRRIQRGGSYYSGGPTLYSGYRDTFGVPSNPGIYTGFRIAEVPEPAAGILLLGLASALIFGRQHDRHGRQMSKY
jgi:formylglycine-generating enzyme required for sulfatase activity